MDDYIMELQLWAFLYLREPKKITHA
jgi:hypothetical protein